MDGLKYRESKGPKFIFALDKYFHGRDGIFCVFVPVSVFVSLFLAVAPNWLTNYPLVFRPRSGGGRESWMLMRLWICEQFTVWAGDSGYLRWPAKDRNIWGRGWYGLPDGFCDLCLFIWYKSSYDDLRWEDTETMTGAHPRHTCVTSTGMTHDWAYQIWIIKYCVKWCN